MAMYCKGMLLKFEEFKGRDDKEFVRVVMLLGGDEPLTVMFEKARFDVSKVKGQEGKEITLPLGNPKKPLMWA